MKLSRRTYSDHFGPTTGDRVRLADTDLIVEVEKDFTTYGEEVKFGGGKVIRDGMGQSARATSGEGVLDLVITNALTDGSTAREDAARSLARAAAAGFHGAGA